MPPKKKLRVIDTNQRKITSMLQQGPELTQDAPASADSESAEPENPSEMPEPPDVDMTETDVSDGSSEMRKFQLHWLQINASPVVTILTDESTDIVVHHKLCISCRIVDPVSLQPSTFFLTDVRLERGTGKAIYDQIQLELKEHNITTRVMGLGTDGASTMTGTKEGLTGWFLRDNPHMVNTHCVAHRLALCTEQSAKKVAAMAEYQRT